MSAEASLWEWGIPPYLAILLDDKDRRALERMGDFYAMDAAWRVITIVGALQEARAELASRRAA